MQKGKVLALDYGKKRIGLASGDFSLRIASAQGVIESKNLSFAISKILDFCKKWEVVLIVIGLPMSMNDRESEMSKNARYFEGKLKEAFYCSKDVVLNKMEIKLFDERLSSFEADGLMSSAGKTSYDKKEYRDSYAAQIILQRFFDSLGK
jgi:putative Holliday junction resolvase